MYQLVQSIPDEVGKVIVGAVSRATGNQLSDQAAIPALIDNLYQGAQDVANQVYSGSFYDIFGALLSLLVLLSAIIFAALAIAAIIAAKVMLFITLALAPIWVVLWLYRWSSRMSEGFLSLTTFLMIQQVLIYGFLGFYFSLVNAALNTATSGGATMDSKMSLVLPLVLVTIIGIYVLMQIPSIASILNGGGYLSTVGAYNPYRNFGRNAVRYSGARWAAGRAARGARQLAANSFRSSRPARADAATRSAIQQGARDNSRPLA
ncbi:type IV secretion system protein [Mesorhizobium sp. M1076]